MLTGTLKFFPQFSKLGVAHRREYELLVRDFPPISDIAFPTLMIWWNFLDSCAVARLGHNLVISYWLPGDDKNSGLSLAGNSNVDQAACAIFDHQKKQGKPARLVHVPELVVSSMRYPELFKFFGERDYDECIVAVDNLYPLNHAPYHMQGKISKFLNATAANKVVMRREDLRLAHSRRTMLESAALWRSKSTLNGNAKLEADAIQVTVGQAEQLGIENVCLYINGRISGLCLYQPTQDKRYVIVSHLEADNKIPHAYEYMIHACAKWFAAQGVTFINFEQDLGLQTLRAHRLALGPSNFFRKYTVEPA